jgi:hypothetical protein
MNQAKKCSATWGGLSERMPTIGLLGQTSASSVESRPAKPVFAPTLQQPVA